MERLAAECPDPAIALGAGFVGSFRQIFIEVTGITPDSVTIAFQLGRQGCAGLRLFEGLAAGEGDVVHEAVGTNIGQKGREGRFGASLGRLAFGVVATRTTVAAPLHEHGVAQARSVHDGVGHSTVQRDGGVFEVVFHSRHCSAPRPGQPSPALLS